jgi:hypothetical protein
MEIERKTGLFQGAKTGPSRRQHRSIRRTMSATVGILIALTQALIGPGSTSKAADPPAATARTEFCGLLSTAEVSRALKVTIIRAEALESDEAGCEFSAKGAVADAGAAHITELAKGTAAAHGTTLDASTQNLINAFGKGIFQGSDSDKEAIAKARHPGEFVVLTVAIQPGDAEEQMRLSRKTYAGLSSKSVTTVVRLGDEAFDTGGAMITVRKGATMIQFRYPSCACTTKDVVPLARKVVDAL